MHRCEHLHRLGRHADAVADLKSIWKKMKADLQAVLDSLVARHGAVFAGR